MKTICQFAYRFDLPARGVPVVDCRVIKNPYNPTMLLTDEQYEYKVRKDPNFEPLVAKAVELFERNDVIAVGCTFGKHRSVIVANEIAKRTGAVVRLRRLAKADPKRSDDAYSSNT